MRNSDVVDAVRQAVDIVQIIGEVVPLKKSGANYFGICPFHTEKSPSFSVSAARQFFHCFGCKAGGDVFKFVQLYYRWDFGMALEELAKKVGIQIQSQRSDPRHEEGFQILEFTARFFQENLQSREGKVFRDYLKSRQIQSNSVEGFRLGAHLGKSTSVVEYLRSKHLSLEVAAGLGIIGRTKSGDFIDRFQGRLIFPLMDEKSRTRGFGGRTLGEDLPKYINSPNSSHFDKGRQFYGVHLASAHILKKGYAVLVEGYFDVIALHEYGVTNAIGSMGTALTGDQIRSLKRWSSRIISLYDADQAGLMATQKNLGNFLKEGMESKVVVLPHSKDPDAFLHSAEMSAEDKKSHLKKAFDASTPALDYLVQKSVLIEREAGARGKKLRHLVETLDQVPDDLQKAVLKKDLAKRFELPENLLFRGAEPMEPPKSASIKPLSVSEPGRWEREIVRFLIHWGEGLDISLMDALPFLLSSTVWGSVLFKIIETDLDLKTIAQMSWLEEMDSEVQAVVREWALEPRTEMEPTEVLNLWRDLLSRLRKSYFERESERLQKAIIQAEKNNEEDKLRGLLAEKQGLTRFVKLKVNEFQSQA